MGAFVIDAHHSVLAWAGAVTSRIVGVVQHERLVVEVGNSKKADLRAVVKRGVHEANARVHQVADRHRAVGSGEISHPDKLVRIDCHQLERIHVAVGKINLDVRVDD